MFIDADLLETVSVDKCGVNEVTSDADLKDGFSVGNNKCQMKRVSSKAFPVQHDPSFVHKKKNGHGNFVLCVNSHKENVRNCFRVFLFGYGKSRAKLKYVSNRFGFGH